MKKLSIIAVALLVAGVVSSWATSTNLDVITYNVPITFKGTLSDKTKVTDATLDQGSLTFAEVAYGTTTSTQTPFHVIGSGIGLTNNVVSGVTNVELIGIDIWDDTSEVGPGDESVVTSKAGAKATTLEGVFSQEQYDLFGRSNLTLNSVISNSVLLVTSTESDPRSKSSSKSTTNVTGKIDGIWKDGSTTVDGTISTFKAK